MLIKYVLQNRRIKLILCKQLPNYACLCVKYQVNNILCKVWYTMWPANILAGIDIVTCVVVYKEFDTK